MSPPKVTFTELVERHRSEMLRYLVRLLGDAQEAEDVCQDAWLRAHRAFTRLRPDSNPRAWLYRIATNCARSSARRRARSTQRRIDLDLDGLPATATQAPERRQELRGIFRAVQALPPRQRAALMLRQFHGMSYAEIAAAVGGNESAARANVYQAIKRLRAVLAEGSP